jgi:hypothetical protein
LRLLLVGAPLTLLGCASPPADQVWTPSGYAQVVALLQSCTGDASLAVNALLAPKLTNFARATQLPPAGVASGCSGLEAERGVVVTANSACVPACEGADAVTCRGSYQIVNHCSTFDSRCAMTNGIPGCLDKQGAIPTEDAGVCPATPVTATCANADRLDICPGYGFQCSQWLAGSTCKDGQCLLGSECIPGKILDGIACDGNLLRVCVAGRIEKVDCTQLGFTGCDSFTRGCTPNPLLAP